MATSQTSTTEPADDVSDIKRKLAWRMGFAGLMIVALLGELALFDHFSVQNEPDTVAPQFNEPVPVAKKVVTQPLAPVSYTHLDVYKRQLHGPPVVVKNGAEQVAPPLPGEAEARGSVPICRPGPPWIRVRPIYFSSSRYLAVVRPVQELSLIHI